MFQKVIEYLKKRGWSYSSKADDSLFISLTNDNGTYHCIIYIKEKTKILAVVSFLGTHCPPEKLDLILHLLNLANNNLLLGNFEINEAGDIKYRTSINLDYIELTEDIIEDLIMRNIYNIDIANPTFHKVMFGNMTSDSAFLEIFPTPKPGIKNIEDIEEITDEESTSKDGV